MKFVFTVLLIFMLACANIQAQELRHGPEAIEVRIETGTKDGQLKFIPNKLSFERGKYYKLVIHNPSDDDHYFTSDALATHVFTRKVEVAGKDHKTVAEIHGAVYDIELKPGATVEWYFYPMTNGKKLELYCHKQGHAEQGMTGEFEIFGSPPFTK